MWRIPALNSRISLTRGFRLPVLTFASIELDLLISSQSTCSGRMIREPSRRNFKGQQRINLSTRSKRTTTRPIHNKITCEGNACSLSSHYWRTGLCLDLGDCLPAFKVPKLLKYGASLHDWQVCRCKNHQHEVSVICTSTRCKISEWVVANYQRKLGLHSSYWYWSHNLDGYLILWAKESVGFEIRLLTINLFT